MYSPVTVLFPFGAIAGEPTRVTVDEVSRAHPRIQQHFRGILVYSGF